MRGESPTQGWLIDTYPDYDRDSIVLWLWTPQGAKRIEDRDFPVSFFLHARPDELPGIAKRIEILDAVKEIRPAQRRIDLAIEDPVPVLEIVPRHYRDLRELAHIVDSNGGYYDHRLYNVDLRFGQRYCQAKGIFPFGLVQYLDGRWRAEEEQFALDYTIPPLRPALLDLRVDAPLGIPRFSDKLLGARLDDVEIDGDEEAVVRGIGEAVRSADPDVLLTDGGDAFAMPYLARKAADLGVELQLGRDPDRFVERRGKSYFTYGKIVYKPGQYLLKGRLHLDRGHFAYRESAMAGLAELSRLSTLMPQEQARLTPGTAISAMQVNLAMRDGVLVLWKKNVPEEFKSAEELVLGDRGGFIFEPEVGLHEGIYELDYSSLYPSIMVKYNVSPECLDCTCCDREAIFVPGLRHHLCTNRVGLIPRVLKPILERRRYYKKMKKEPGPLQSVYSDRDSILKWLLVTCLDARTIIPCKVDGTWLQKSISEIIDPFLPEKGILEPPQDLRVLGYDSGLNIVEKKVSKIMKLRSPPRMVRIRLQKGREIFATPNHGFFVLTNRGDLERRNAENLRVGDYLPVATTLPRKYSGIRSVNLAARLIERLSGDELFMWRIRGPALKDAISRQYKTVLHEALKHGYMYRTVWLWRQKGIVPLAFLPLLNLDRSELDTLEVGRSRRGGGEINFLPCSVEVDRDLGFFLGFYAGDGNAKANMVRFAIGMTEPEILGKLMDCADGKFGLLGSVRKEKKARMWVLQFNSIALKRIIETVFEMGESAEKGKLVVPPLVLNADEEVRLGFVEGLIASDGSIAPGRDWAMIHTASREFADSIGLLLASLGLSYVTRCPGLDRQVIYSVGFRLRQLKKRLWMKVGHRKRTSRFVTRDLGREGRIPVHESGLFTLCQKYKVTHQLSRSAERVESAKKVLSRLQRIREKSRQVAIEDLRVIENLEKLAGSNIGFFRITALDEANPRSEFVYCFEVEEEPNGFIVQGNVFLSNCFGYTGYKNARFGRIECHEAINALARDLMLRTSEIAESHRYDVIHGIVDSVWLHPRADSDPIRTVVDHIAGSTGLTIELEGRYKWIVFLPAKTTGVGALNRYYGLLENGEFKLRGIELRRHDTPDFINVAQEAMLGELSLAETAAEFQERLPRAINVLRWTARRILDRAIPLPAFVLTKSVTKGLDEYLVLTATVAALKQLKARGFTVEPGESVRYVLTDQASRDYEAKVKVAEFLDGTEEVDAPAYIRLLARAGETLLAPFGYTEEKLFALCRDPRDAEPCRVDPADLHVQEDYKTHGHSKARGGVGYQRAWRVLTDPAIRPGEE